MTLPETIKNNPIKTLVGSATTLVSITALITAMFSLDARYAHADEVATEANKTQQFILSTTQDLRKQQLEDKIFELDLKKSQTKKPIPTDDALRSRYQRQLDDISFAQEKQKIQSTVK